MNPATANSARNAPRRLRRFATSLVVIFLFATGVRLGFAWDYARQNSREALSVVPFLFEPGNIAVSIAHGEGFASPLRVATGPTAWMAPLYPLLLAGVFRYLGVYTFSSFVAATLLNILFSALTCAPIYHAGKRIGGAGLGAGAAWLWAIFPNAILIPFESMWDASLSALLAATILWATLALTGARSTWGWCGYGLLWGVTLMTNPTLICLLPLLLGWLAFRAYQEEHPRLKGPLLALIVAMLCCVPWTVRNYDVFHAFVPLRSGLGLELWLGNNPQSTSFTFGSLHPINNAEERAKYIALGEVAYMREKRREAIAYMLSHPRIEAQRTASRFVALWTGGTEHPISDFGRNHSAWFRYVLLFNVCAAAGGLAGIALLFGRRSIFAFPLAVFPIVFPCAYYLTIALPRYRLPIDPAVLLLAATAFAALVRWLTRRGSEGPATSF